MPLFSCLSNPAPYHVIAFGTLFGSQFFQTFIGGTTAFRALPRPQFSQLQSRVFPIYFGIQSFYPIILLITHPHFRFLDPLNSITTSPSLYAAIIPIGLGFLSGLVNSVLIGPKTQAVMRERKVLEAKEGRRYYETYDGGHSEDMKKVNKKFAKLHGISSALNLVSLVASTWYGNQLANRIVF
ncbi:hypothetical protein BJ508DRAFT_2531 [Ascobolus immersus RN42]|uniref:TMEM205-like domain-containing protein n=1 Tax=Ascobolus immersus RN42 TaxID=1160509 RepID=A0A3N4ITN8_ASCIM|nr:hypothetical protein BJ508DRAFT_2531 [Ascobolus immersus RN42]